MSPDGQGCLLNCQAPIVAPSPTRRHRSLQQQCGAQKLRCCLRLVGRCPTAPPHGPTPRAHTVPSHQTGRWQYGMTRNGFHIQYKVRPAQFGLLSSKAKKVRRSVNTSAVDNGEKHKEFQNRKHSETLNPMDQTNVSLPKPGPGLVGYCPVPRSLTICGGSVAFIFQKFMCCFKLIFGGTFEAWNGGSPSVEK